MYQQACGALWDFRTAAEHCQPHELLVLLHVRDVSMSCQCQAGRQSHSGPTTCGTTNSSKRLGDAPVASRAPWQGIAGWHNRRLPQVRTCSRVPK